MALENGKTSAVAVMDPPIVVTAWQLHPSLPTGTKMLRRLLQEVRAQVG
jgi:hypothetical protein